MTRDEYEQLIDGASQCRFDSCVYGYARISKPTQSISRQIRNISTNYGNAKIYQEAYTGTKLDRPEWNKLYKQVLADKRTGKLVTIVFDSVSRMSRNAEEGIKLYMEMYRLGIDLVFLKEPYINTETYQNAKNRSIKETGNEIADIYIKATNELLILLARNQIKQAFEQAEKEVEDLHQRTKEGIETARMNGKQIGQQKGRKLYVKKAEAVKEMILKHSKSFGGTLTVTELMNLVKVVPNTYYKYKRELKK